MLMPTLMFNLINIIVGLIEATISLRVILKFAGANPATPFVAWVYETSRSLIWPFIGMFPSPTLNGSVIEFNSLIALLVYAFIGYLLLESIGYVSARTSRQKVVVIKD
ncbi:MAG: hypothetical protein ACMG6E_02520 [Candidatus Roizmanbacteria bacterium]